MKFVLLIFAKRIAGKSVIAVLKMTYPQNSESSLLKSF